MLYAIISKKTDFFLEKEKDQEFYPLIFSVA